MELKKVCTEADDDSTASLDDRFTEPIDSEKATINRCGSILYQLFYLRLSTEKKTGKKAHCLSCGNKNVFFAKLYRNDVLYHKCLISYLSLSNVHNAIQ